MNYAAMMRVKNEERWIERSIQSLLPICGRIFILDDHSDDLTPHIANSYDETEVFLSPFHPEAFSETRDKEWLLRQIKRSGYQPDYVICIDGDEELEPAGPEKIRKLTADSSIVAARLKILYLWDDPNMVRVDGCYRHYARASLFRYHPQVTAFKSAYSTTLHCTNVPAQYVQYAVDTDIRLLHWGYYDRADRIRKYHWYNARDPENEREDRYRHMVIGDLYPGDQRGLHAGPLTLEPLRL
jgi:glycosyltransferase involved in cell wall biosynthesis